jgi:hypothetical protein
VVTHEEQGSPILREFGLEGEAWMVGIKFRDGLKPSTLEYFICMSEDEATEISDAIPVGSEYPDPRGGGYIRWHNDAGGSFLVARVGDFQMPKSVLIDAGILDPSGHHTSQSVLEYLGHERVEKLKARFGEYWEAAAHFEYCWQELPHSSAAYVAAACRYENHITGNYFAAGYFLRDLEVLVHGVEAVALTSLETRRQAGARGGAKSAESRQRRMSSLMDAVEYVASRNPDVVKLGEEALGHLALESAVETDTRLWNQGKNQVWRVSWANPSWRGRGSVASPLSRGHGCKTA